MADKPLNSIKFPDLPDRYTLDHKANIDGSYEGMTVGNAEQLVSSIVENDQTPYLFRTAGGNREIGNRENDTIVGVSLPWNQLASLNSADWMTTRASVSFVDKTITVSATSSTTTLKYAEVPVQNGHKYLFIGKVTTDTTIGGFIGIYVKDVSTYKSRISFPTDTVTDFAHVFNVDENDLRFCILLPTGAVANTTISIDKPQLFDLTQMFGITIADYIYSLEQANAGAGVEFFKKLFPKDYYEYNAVEMLHVSGLQSHDMVGFNQWDEEWESGAYNASTGAKVGNSATIRSKNYIPCLPNTIYFNNDTSGHTYVFFYDADKNYISFGDYKNMTFTTPSNARFMTFYKSSGYGTTYNHDICINLHWDGERDGEYEPYVKHSYPLDSSLTLRGIPKLDTDGNFYYDGDEYASDGTVTRKYGYVTLNGTESGWLKSSTDNGSFYINFNAAGIPSFVAMSYCVTPNLVSVVKNADYTKGCAFVENASINFWYPEMEGKTLEEFKAWISEHPIHLVYELATPTTESAEPFADPQIVDNWGTEEYVTSSIIPVGHDTDYPVDLKAKVEASPNNPQSDGTYILSYQNGEATYTPLASNATITNIIARLEALEGGE